MSRAPFLPLVGKNADLDGETMLIILGGILLVFWLLGITVFKVTKGAIHLVLLVAIVVLVLHFVRGG
jgi:hypothetical protein